MHSSCSLAIRSHVISILLATLALVAPAHGQNADTGIVPLLAASSDPLHQGFVRVVNRSEVAGEVTIEAIDDAGMGYTPVTLSLAGGQAMHFNSDDLEHGNADKGLSGGVGPGEGQWRLELSSDLEFDVLSYMRHRGDGYLTSLHDLAPEVDGAYYVAFLNPGSNTAQVGMLRLTNPEDTAVNVRISGLDDTGESPGSDVALTLEPLASRTLTAAELESGSVGGLSGALGDGAGKWRVRVQADGALRVMSLLQSPTGHLANLSSVPPPTVASSIRAYRVPWFPSDAAAQNSNQGFVRVINHSDREGTVRIGVVASAPAWRGADGWDVWRDANGYELSRRVFSSVELTIGPNAVAHFNSQDLAMGNADKGLPVGVEASLSDYPLWQLELRSELDIEVLAYSRSADGFVTSMHDLVPDVGGEHHVAFLNPGSNQAQESVLALINLNGYWTDVQITAVDDQGHEAGPVEVDVRGATVVLRSTDLEFGHSLSRYPAREAAERVYGHFYDSGDEFYRGALGDGSEKWRLRVESEVPIQVMSLLLSPTGHVTNLSSAPGVLISDIDPSLSPNPVTPSSGAATVEIPDATLRRIVQAELGKAEGASISPADMATLKQIDIAIYSPWALGSMVRRPCISDFTGLETAVNLERLFASDNYDCTPPSLAPLSGLGNLRVLDLSVSDIEDLSPLDGLTNLRVLNLSDSSVEDISALTGMTSLEVLDLRDTGFHEVGDFSPLARLTGLRVLRLPATEEDKGLDFPEADYTPIAGLTALEELRGLHASGADDLAWLAGMTSLKRLEIWEMNDHSPLAELTGLQWLELVPGEDDLSALAPLVGLRVLSLYEPPQDLAPLGGMTGLVEIVLESGLVEDVSALSGMSGLVKVWLGRNNIGDLAPLVDNTGLGSQDVVVLSGNPLIGQSANIAGLQDRGVIVVR